MRCRYGFLVTALGLITGLVLFGQMSAVAQGPTYHRGRSPATDDLRAWDTAVGPEGKELPAGSGTAQQGQKVFAQRCAACHGADGKYQWPLRAHPPSGGKAPILAGENGVVESRQFATTIWDYINRAMPLGREAGTLSADEVYAVTAYLLYLDGIVKETDVLDAKSLPKIRMPHGPAGR